MVYNPLVYLRLNIRCSPNTIKIYDSLNQSCPVEPTRAKLMKQLCCLVGPDNSLIVEWVDVKKQVGGSDCGLFAIANAAALCDGSYPEEGDWQQHLMRPHLIACFSTGTMATFPIHGQRPSAGMICVTKESVFCHCKLPYDRRTMMVQCGSCSGWFHRDCDVMPRHATHSSKFVCKYCT